MLERMFILGLIFCLGCKMSGGEMKNENADMVNSAKAELTPEQLELHNEKYKALKNRIATFRKQSNHMNSDKVKQQLASYLVDSIFPYWLGTRWDFNGYTEKPLDGEIACGYFVSTTIRDLGEKINRYKIAQKGASDIIKSLCNPNSIQRFNSFDKMLNHLAQAKEYEVFLVGLDFHVGFIYKKKGKLYFAHSSYLNRKGVEIESINKSAVLKNSQVYVLGRYL